MPLSSEASRHSGSRPWTARAMIKSPLLARNVCPSSAVWMPTKSQNAPDSSYSFEIRLRLVTAHAFVIAVAALRRIVAAFEFGRIEHDSENLGISDRRPSREKIQRRKHGQSAA